MSPYTIAQNYSLDGAIDFVQNPTLARWLEVHPANPGGQESDMPGNPNESLIARLKRVKALFAGTPAKLEAQIWGFEPGGFYRFLGGFPALTDLLSGQTMAVGNNFVSLAAPTPSRRESAQASMIREHIIGVLNGRSEHATQTGRALLKTTKPNVSRGNMPLPDPLPYWWEKRRANLPNPLLYGSEQLSPSARISAIKYFLADEMIDDLLAAPKRRSAKAGFGFARSAVIEDIISELLGPPRRQPGTGPATTRYRLADALFSPEFPPPKPKVSRGNIPLPDPLPYWPQKHRALLGVPLPWEVAAHGAVTALGRLAQTFDELAREGIVTSVTTNPLGCQFRRMRFHGHVLPDGAGGWRRAIPNAWPQAVTTALANKIVTATPNNNRAFYLHPDYPEANLLRAQTSAMGTARTPSKTTR
ncbi:MAG: hypothetical protein HC853_01680 [Anaerolineae bacterium]|nr:hypothetical protein [Anaerolineae bacterium]